MCLVESRPWTGRIRGEFAGGFARSVNTTMMRIDCGAVTTAWEPIRAWMIELSSLLSSDGADGTPIRS